MARRRRLQPSSRTSPRALRPGGLTRADPIAPGERLDHAPDVPGQTQLEEIGKPARLRLAHDAFIAEAAVAAQNRRPQVARKAVEERPQAGRAVLGRMLVAGADVDVENQPRRGHRISVIAMARPSGLLRIVAENRPLLMAVERLDRRIDIEDPRLGEQRLHAKGQMTAQPGRAFPFVDHLERPPDRVLAHDLRHAEQLRQHPVPADRRDMRVPLRPGQHRQHRRAQDVPLLRRVGAAIPERTIRDERVEQPRRLQIVDEERKLTERRHRRVVVPLDPHRPAEAVDLDP